MPGRHALPKTGPTMRLAEQVLEPVAKPASYRDLGPVDISGLLPLVGRMSDQTWKGEDARKENDFACFHHTRHVVFRFTPGNRSPRQFYADPAWSIWSRLLLPVMHRAVASYRFTAAEFPKVMFARLEAGQLIDRHRDGAGSNLLTHKIHVPLVTNPDALFESGGVVRHLAAGHAYEVNNIDDHSARNGGAADRIHLIFEVFESLDRRDRLTLAKA